MYHCGHAVTRHSTLHLGLGTSLAENDFSVFLVMHTHWYHTEWLNDVLSICRIIRHDRQVKTHNMSNVLPIPVGKLTSLVKCIFVRFEHFPMFFLSTDTFF